MFLFALSDVRDLVLVVWGAVSILLTLIVLAIVGAVLYFGMKGMRAIHRLTNKNLVEQVERIRKLADQVRDRTAKLPGAPGGDTSPAGLVAAAREMRDVQPPFRRRVKSWRPF